MKSSEPIEAHPFAEFIMNIPTNNAVILLQELLLQRPQQSLLRLLLRLRVVPQ